jgi:hypothetical protein
LCQTCQWPIWHIWTCIAKKMIDDLLCKTHRSPQLNHPHHGCNFQVSEKAIMARIFKFLKKLSWLESCTGSMHELNGWVGQIFRRDRQNMCDIEMQRSNTQKHNMYLPCGGIELLYYLPKHKPRTHTTKTTTLSYHGG